MVERSTDDAASVQRRAAGPAVPCLRGAGSPELLPLAVRPFLELLSVSFDSLC